MIVDSVGKAVRTVNCKTTIQGTYTFSYEVDYGGGGICNSGISSILACQEAGSVYVDNQVFMMQFAKCPEVTSSVGTSESLVVRRASTRSRTRSRQLQG